MTRHTILVAFDTPSDARRRRLTRLLARHGCRVQRSVYEVLMTPAELEQLWLVLTHLADAEADQVLIGRMQPGTLRHLGNGPQAEYLLALTV